MASDMETQTPLKSSIIIRLTIVAAPQKEENEKASH